MGKKGKKVWRATPLCLFWIVWKERNSRVFRTCFRVGSGNKVKFWKDGWCEDLPLRDVFLNLFSITFSKDARMVDVWDNGSWNPRFIRQLND